MRRSRYGSYGAGAAAIKAGKIARLYLIWGDDYLCGRLKRLLREALFGDGGEEFDLSRVDGTVHGPGELLGLIRTTPFLSSRRLVIVERVRAFRAAADGAAEGSARTAAGSGGVQPGSPSSGEAWERLIAGVPETCCLVLSLEAPPDARLRLTKLAASHGELVECDTSGRSGTALAGQALRERAAELGCDLGWRERSLLLSTVGTDCGRLVAELEKIAVYCGDRAPSEHDILRLCARTAEGDIWQLLDAVDAGRADQAVRIVRAALAGGESPVALVASLASQVRMMARTRERFEAGVKPEAMAAALGANRYWVEQSFRRARRFSLASLYGAICELARLDLRIKTGTVDGAAGVETFVLGLCAARAAGSSNRAAGAADGRSGRVATDPLGGGGP